jgi:branched-chain amino acid transport system substrate-binding protein
VKKLLFGLAAALGLSAAPAFAQINVGVILSQSGNAATLGIPARNTVAIWPKTIAGQTLKVTVLDDGSDPTAATMAARKLINEQKIDVLVGPSITPTSLSAMQVTAEQRTPMISLGGGGALVNPMDDTRRWVFKMPPAERIPVALILKDMNERKKTRLAIVASADAYGQVWLDVMQKAAGGAGVEVVAAERFAAADTGFVSQALKIMAAKPDAVFIIASGTAATMPQLELTNRGYKGQFYQTMSFSLNDFLRIGGTAVEGTRMPTTTALVAEQLDDGNVIKPVATRYVQAYQTQYKELPTISGAQTWDAFLLMEHAVPKALAKAQPGTEAFRAALRDALEQAKDVVLTEGVYTMTPQDHNGADERSLVMAEIKGGKWVIVK